MAAIKKRVWEKRQQERFHPIASAPKVASFDYDGADTAWACARKKAYADESFARRVARQVRETHGHGVELVAYACRHCGSYHIGRAPTL